MWWIAVLACSGDEGGGGKDNGGGPTGEDSVPTVTCGDVALEGVFSGDCEVPSGVTASVSFDVALDPETCAGSGYLSMSYRDAYGVSTALGWGVEGSAGPLPVVLTHEPPVIDVAVPVEAVDGPARFTITYDGAEDVGSDVFGMSGGGGFQCDLSPE